MRHLGGGRARSRDHHECRLEPDSGRLAGWLSGRDGVTGPLGVAPEPTEPEGKGVVVEQPGVVEVEEHESGFVILQLQVS
ncbi:MAG: hypothetical protein ACR2HA_12785 [Nocardioides sp.]